MIFWIEASQQIGMGHLMESLVLAEYFMSQNRCVHFIVNPYEPCRAELQKRGMSFTEHNIEEVDEVARCIEQKNAASLIINHRKVSLTSLERFYSKECTITVIDQLGNIPIICDLLINKAIVPEWLQYDFVKGKPRCCFGADYAILKDSVTEIRSQQKIFAKVKYTVLVSMGGVDRTGATLRIMEALRLLKNVRKEIVVGSGFAHWQQLQELYKEYNDPTFVISKGVDDFERRISEADLVISAGGNTLYEISCLGTPGIVLWEDPHECLQGEAFEDKGSVVCLGNGLNTPTETITESIDKLLKDVTRRENMRQCAIEMVDGFGKRRIASMIGELVSIGTRQ